MLRYKPSGFFIPREGVQYGALPGQSNPAPRPTGFKTLTVDLTTAAVDREFPINGNTLWYLDSTASSDRVRVRYDDNDSDPLPFRPGISVVGRPFSRVLLSWDATPGSTATLAYTNDPAANELQVQ